MVSHSFSRAFARPEAGAHALTRAGTSGAGPGCKKSTKQETRGWAPSGLLAGAYTGLGPWGLLFNIQVENSCQSAARGRAAGGRVVQATADAVRGPEGVIVQRGDGLKRPPTLARQRWQRCLQRRSGRQRRTRSAPREHTPHKSNQVNRKTHGRGPFSSRTELADAGKRAKSMPECRAAARGGRAYADGTGSAANQRTGKSPRSARTMRGAERARELRAW